MWVSIFIHIIINRVAYFSVLKMNVLLEVDLETIIRANQKDGASFKLSLTHGYRVFLEAVKKNSLLLPSVGMFFQLSI